MADEELVVPHEADPEHPTRGLPERSPGGEGPPPSHRSPPQHTEVNEGRGKRGPGPEGPCHPQAIHPVGPRPDDVGGGAVREGRRGPVEGLSGGGFLADDARGGLADGIWSEQATGGCQKKHIAGRGFRPSRTWSSKIKFVCTNGRESLRKEDSPSGRGGESHQGDPGRSRWSACSG